MNLKITVILKGAKVTNIIRCDFSLIIITIILNMYVKISLFNNGIKKQKKKLKWEIFIIWFRIFYTNYSINFGVVGGCTTSSDPIKISVFGKYL